MWNRPWPPGRDMLFPACHLSQVAQPWYAQQGLTPPNNSFPEEFRNLQPQDAALPAHVAAHMICMGSCYLFQTVLETGFQSYSWKGQYMNEAGYRTLEDRWQVRFPQVPGESHHELSKHY